MNLVFEERDCTLLIGQEVGVRCNDVDFASAGDGRIVMQAGRSTVDIEPRAYHVYRLSKVNCHTCITRSIATVVARVTTKNSGTNLDDGCRASWVWHSREEVSRIIVAISAPVILPQNCTGIAGRRGVCSLSAV